MFARHDRLRENAEPAILCRGHRPARRKKRYIRSQGERKKANRGVLAAMQTSVELT